jgi:hypothetical protein
MTTGFVPSELLAELEELLAVVEELLASGVSNLMSGSYIPHTFRTSYSVSEFAFSDVVPLLEPTTSLSMEPRNEFTSEPEDLRSPSMGKLPSTPSAMPDDDAAKSVACTLNSTSGIELFRAPSSTLGVEKIVSLELATIGSSL